MKIEVRRATKTDAEQIGGLVQEFVIYLRELGDPTDFQFTSDSFLRDGFGLNPAFEGLVAEDEEGMVVGYLLYHFGYDIDHAARVMHIVDLFVQETHRLHGVGRTLIESARRICAKAGVREMIWSVYKPNQLAHRFYRHLGAEYINDLDFMHMKVSLHSKYGRNGTKS